MGKMIASFSTIEASSGPGIPYQDLLCLAAAFAALICLVAAAGICLSTQQESTPPVSPDD